MTNEIKEILDILARRLPYAVAPELAYMTAIITPQECKILLDYITNLQEELEKTKLENKVLKEQMVAMVQPNYVYGIELRGEDK